MKSASRITKIAIISLSIFSFLMLDSCKFYKEVPIYANEHDPWEGAMNRSDLLPARNINLKTGTGTYQYQLQNYTIDGDVLKGELVAINYFPIPDKKTFGAKNIPKEKRVQFLSTLFISSDKPLAEGDFSINISEAGQLTRYEVDKGSSFAASFALTAGIVVVGTTAALAAIVAIACNCPRVYIVDANGDEHLQGPLFTGAISKSFERRDLMPLKGIDRSNDQVVIRVKNELPEDEYINELKLLRITHRPDYQIGMDASEELFEFNKLEAPREAVSLSGSDLKEATGNLDALFYEFDDETYLEELNSATFTFDKPTNNSQKLKLVIHARQTKWLEQVTESYFRLHGNEFDKVNSRMGKIPIGLYNRNMAKYGISMNAYVMTKNGWSKLGVFKNAGTVKKLYLGMDIDLKEIEGEEIKIKLESAFRFWELDQIGITMDWKLMENYEEVPFKSAINEKGEDVSTHILAVDNQYVVQAEEGTFVELTYDNVAQEEEIYVLQGTGYYHHKRNYTHEAEKKAIRQIKARGKLAAHELSYWLHRYTKATASNNQHTQP